MIVFGSTIPAGTYPAILVEYRPFETTYEGQPRELIAWTFQIGDDPAARVDRVTSNATGPKSSLRELVAGLLGRQPEAGESIDPTRLIGLQALIMVEENDKGFVKVSGVAALPKQAAKPVVEDLDNLPF